MPSSERTRAISMRYPPMGALDHDSFGRTRSEVFARRVVDALNRANPGKLRDPHAPPKAGWF